MNNITKISDITYSDIADYIRLSEVSEDEQNYLTTKNNHNDSIGDLLRVNDNAFLSCSFDGLIQLWSY